MIGDPRTMDLRDDGSTFVRFAVKEEFAKKQRREQNETNYLPVTTLCARATEIYIYITIHLQK